MSTLKRSDEEWEADLESGVTIRTERGIDLVSVEHGGLTEIFATALPNAEDNLASLRKRVLQLLRDTGGEILEMRVFGNADAFAMCTRLLQELFGDIDWPLLLVEGGNCFGGEVAGIQLHAVADSTVETILLDGLPVGRVFTDDHARYCVLGDLHSPDPSRSPERQTQDTIEQLLEGLASAGMDIHNIVRTWFFIKDILEWYPEFNRVRSEIYSAAGVFDRFLPSSTGIGGSNSHGAAVVGSALGIQARKAGVTVREIPSPLQRPAFDYGSSFSRAAELETPDCRSVFVSGTASIDPSGATVHVGDLDAQIRFTLEVVGAILESRDMDFGDVVRGNAYFKDFTGTASLEQHMRRTGLPASRVVVSQDCVCREDLLFEMEVQAMKVKDSA